MLSSCSLAPHDDGEPVAGRAPGPHLYACMLPAVAAVGILPLLWLCLWLVGGTAVPPWSRKWVPRGMSSMGRTAGRTGDKAHSDGDTHLGS